MTNTIGALEIANIHNPPNPSYSGNMLKLEGHFSTRAELTQLEEMFRKAEGGTTIHTIVGGVQTGYDCTEGSVLTQYCTFDEVHLKDGYYLIRKLGINYIQYPSYYPFSIELFFLGTTDLLAEAYSIFGLDETESDWGL